MKSKLNNPLSYGTLATVNNVRVEKAFGSENNFLIGRTAATAPHFPTKFSESSLGVLTGAANGTDVELVGNKAFAELVERVSAFEAASEIESLMRGTLNDLEKLRETLVVSPSSLQHFADWQRLPSFIDRNPDQKVRTWCRGIRISTGEIAYVPALAAYLQWQSPTQESLFIWPGATGLAAGTERNATLFRAMLEVIERDACMASWRVPGYPIFQLSVELIPESLQRTCALLGLMLEIYCIETENLPPTVLAVLSKENDVELTCGSACGILNQELIAKAIGEALMLQWTMRNCAKEVLSIPSKPQTSYQHVAAVFHSGSKVASWYRRQAVKDGLKKTTSGLENIQELARAAEQTFQSLVVAVDVTSSTAKSSGWNVFRVVIPGALPRESDARISHLGGTRLEHLLNTYSIDQQMLQTTSHPFG